MYYKNDETRIYSCETVTQVSVTNTMSLTNKSALKILLFKMHKMYLIFI